MIASHSLPEIGVGSTIVCTLDCGARTFAYSVGAGAPVVVFEGLPEGRVMYPAALVTRDCGDARMRMLEHYTVPHIWFVVRTRVMCQADRARAAGARGDIVAWLCERAPLWVVVHVCALLRG